MEQNRPDNNVAQYSGNKPKNFFQNALIGLVFLLLIAQVYLLYKYLNPYPRSLKPSAPTAILFEQNSGQFSVDAEFKTRHDGYEVYFSDRGLAYLLPSDKIYDVVEEQFVGRLDTVQLDGIDLAQARANYLIGNQPSEWITDIPHYSKIEYQNLYPGIDLQYYSKDGQLKQDFIVAPESNPDLIVLQLSNTKKLQVNRRGELIMKTREGNKITKKAPIAFQIIGGEQVDVPVGFKIISKNQYGFKLGDYNPEYALIIDPFTTVYSTYFGGSGFEPDTQLAVDSAGNAYVSGGTPSNDFPTTAGVYDQTYNGGDDVYLSKFDSTGSLVYSTYIGGANNDEIARDLTIDSSGNAYIAVSTDSTDYPTTAGAYDTTFNGGGSDIAVTKLNSTGSALVYSTYIGSDGTDSATAIQVDSDGNAYVGGFSSDPDFPTTAGAYNQTHNDSNSSGDNDAVIVKLNATGTALTYSTFLGGEDDDFGAAHITLDDQRNVYFIVSTDSSDFPTTAGVYDTTHNGGTDLAIGKLNSTGSSLLLSTFVGGSGTDNAYSIKLDSSDNIYFSGSSDSNNFPTVNAYQGAISTGIDGVFGKLNPTASTLLNSSYYGGNGTDIVRDIQINSGNQLYLVLSSSSTGLTTLDEVTGFDDNTGSTDGFLAKLASDLTTLIFATYYGGTSFDIPLDIHLDSASNIFTFMLIGSNDFPTVNAYQGTYGGGVADGGLVKFTFNDTPVASGVAISGTTTAQDLDVNFSLADTDVGAAPKGVIDWRLGGTSMAIINGAFEADTSSGSSAKDYSTHSQTMTVTGAVFDPDGGVDGGGTYVFDGVDDVIAVANDDASQHTANLTIAAWIKRAGSGIGGEQRILEMSEAVDGNQATYNLKIDTNTNLVRAEVQDNTATLYELLSTSTIPLNTWTHVALTHDSVNTKLYINGVEEAALALANPIQLVSNATGIGIGNQVERNRPFHGSIDELLLLNRGLSADQIANLYNRQTDILDSNETAVGNSWVACVSPTDFINEGSTVCSSAVTVALCGNSTLETSETCDDGNAVDGDGCASSCTVETGWTCDNSPLPSTCTADWQAIKGSRGYGKDYRFATADASFLGENAGDALGWDVESAGDVNNDGLQDFLIASIEIEPLGGSFDGKSYLFFGKTSGWSLDTNVSNSDASFIGEAQDDQFGYLSIGIGDVNGDGFDDFALAAPTNDETAAGAGQVYIVFGRAANDPFWTNNKAISTSADASFRGEAAGDGLGFFVSAIGDVNNDGFDDFAMGAIANDEGPGDDAGQVYIIHGRNNGSGYWTMDKDPGATADASFLGEVDSDLLGGDIEGVGDVNNDGFDDFIIGTTRNDEGPGDDAGQTYLIFGRLNSSGYWTMDKAIGSTADASFIGEADSDNSGIANSGGGDFNNDGFDDILITSHLNDEGGADAGQIYVIFGKSAGWAMDTSLASADASFIGAAGYQLSYGASKAGDLNKDGIDDFVVGATGADVLDTDAGTVYAIFGKATGWAMDTPISTADASFHGEGNSDFAGIWLSELGDVNGDNVDDFLTSAYVNDEAGANAGQVYLILSPEVIVPESPSAPPPCPTVQGTIQNFSAQLGQSGDNSAIDLNWSISGAGSTEQITVYRGVGQNITLPQMLPIASNLATTETSYQDVFTQTAQYGKTYTYALQLTNTCGNSKSAQFSDPFTLPNRYTDGTEINMELQLNVKVKEVRDQLLLNRIKEVLGDQNNSSEVQPILRRYIQSFRQPSYLVAQAGESDISITQFYQSDLRSRVRQTIHNAFFAPDELVTADPLKFDFYNKNKEFLFHKTIGHFIDQKNLEPTDAQLNNFLQPLVQEVLDQFNSADTTEEALKTKLQQEGLLSINPNTLTSIDDILNNPSLKAAILSIPNIENLIKGHSEQVLLEVWNPGDRNNPVFSQQITTNIFGEASVTLPNFVTGTYDFTLKLPGTLRKSVPIQKANTDTLVLNFSGDDAGLKFGDFNDDGQINLDDIKFLRTGFSQNPTQFDLNEDGRFDLSDVFETLKNFGTE